MRDKAVWVLARGKICMALLLGAILIALVFGHGDVVLSQTGTSSAPRAPLFTAIDLTPGESVTAKAFAASGGQQVGFIVGHAAGDHPHAFLWRNGAGAVVDLHPGGFIESKALGTSNGQQAGYGYGSATGGAAHALLWYGSATRVVDLHPSGFVLSQASSIWNDQQAGYGYGPATGGATHALLWRGSAGSVLDLHPSGFVNSQALGTAGGEQVGFGVGVRVIPPDQGIGNTPHALLWHGTAASVVDLRVPNYLNSSEAFATSGAQQVGYGYGDRRNSHWPVHALLWRGSAASMVDLHPNGYDRSLALDICGELQVGYGVTSVPPIRTRALLWRGTAASVLDLNAFLPQGFESAQAFGFDASGDIVGAAGGPASGWGLHAFLWKRNEPRPATEDKRQCDIPQ